MKKSISYWSFSGKNVFEAMRLAKDAGFDGIELTLDAEGDVTMETAPEKLAEIAEEHPVVKALIVPREKLAEMRVKVEQSGTRENLLYKNAVSVL